MSDYYELVKLLAIALLPSLLTYFLTREKNKGDINSVHIANTEKLIKLSNDRLDQVLRQNRLLRKSKKKLSDELMHFNRVATELKDELLDCNKKHTKSDQQAAEMRLEITQLKQTINELQSTFNIGSSASSFKL